MSSFVERAGSGRTRCTVCGEAIAKGALRTVDETVSYVQDEERTRRTYLHLACAVDIERHQAYAALVGTRTTDEIYELAIAEVARSDAKLVEESRAHRPQRVEKRSLPLADRLTGELLAGLEASPGDRGLLAVLADQLQEAGDERGELIVLDLGAAARSQDDLTAIKRRSELARALSPQLGPHDKATWGVGFFKKLHVQASGGALLAILAHPTCRLLESLELQRPGAMKLTADALPRTLRSLHIHGDLAAGSDLAALRYLERLRVADLASLAHPTLSSLALEEAHHRSLHALSLDDVPGLVHLAIARHNGDRVVSELVRGGWFARLETLELSYLFVDRLEIDDVAQALAGRRLRKLTITGTRLHGDERPRLERLCDELVFAPYGPQGPARDVYFEHANKPDWGRGKLLREHDGKVDVEFASGTRTFKADAPFLRRVT